MALTGKAKRANDTLFRLMLALAAVLAIFAVALQPDRSLLRGFWTIQVSHAGLITDPMAVGGAGAALLNAAVMLLGSLLLVRLQKMPFTGLTVACLFMMAGFSLLGKNLLNSIPILLGGLCYALYKGEKFSKYTYISLFATCLAPMVSYFMLHFDLALGWRILFTLTTGLILGFATPAVSGYTVRIHQGYDLYNVGLAAGFVGLGLISLLRGFGIVFETKSTWSTEYDLPLTLFMTLVIAGLLALGVVSGCRSWKQYRHILDHSGRAVADFFALEGLPVTFVNMALVGLIGLLYLKLVQAPLNGPLVCCLLAMTGFGCFGKHPKNVTPLMAGAALAALVLPGMSINGPGVLLASLLCTGLAPIAGQFGPLWGVAAGFLHMTIVQNTAYLCGGLNLYNNGFAAGLTCIIMIPLIEALHKEPED